MNNQIISKLAKGILSITSVLSVSNAFATVTPVRSLSEARAIAQELILPATPAVGTDKMIVDVYPSCTYKYVDKSFSSPVSGGFTIWTYSAHRKMYCNVEKREETSVRKEALAYCRSTFKNAVGVRAVALLPFVKIERSICFVNRGNFDCISVEEAQKKKISGTLIVSARAYEASIFLQCLGRETRSFTGGFSSPYRYSYDALVRRSDNRVMAVPADSFSPATSTVPTFSTPNLTP